MRLVRARNWLHDDEWRFIGLVAVIDVLLMMAVVFTGQMFGTGKGNGLTLLGGVVALCCANGLLMRHWARVKRLEGTGNHWHDDEVMKNE